MFSEANTFQDDYMLWKYCGEILAIRRASTFADGLFTGLIVAFIFLILGYYFGLEQAGKVVDDPASLEDEPADYPRYKP